MHENANTRVGQKEGLLIGFDTNKDGSSLLAVVKIDINKYKVAADTATRILLVGPGTKNIRTWPHHRS